MKGWLWCAVCKAFRHVNGDAYCWRCGWDLQARRVPRSELLRALEEES